MSNATINRTVTLALLAVSALNPRKRFNQETIDELASSISSQGVLQNLIVRAVAAAPGQPESFEIVAGERRYRALQTLLERGEVTGEFEVPVQVRDLTDIEALMLATAENVQRDDMHPMETAQAFNALYLGGQSVEEIHLRTGRAKSSISKAIALGSNSIVIVQNAYLEGQISLEQVQALILLTAEDQDAIMAEHAKETFALAQCDQLADDADAPEGKKVLRDQDGNRYVARDGEVPTLNYSGLPQAWNIRRRALDGAIPFKRAAFDEQVYLDKGGNMLKDMFDSEEGRFFLNREIFFECQRIAMREVAIILNKDGINVHEEDAEPNAAHFAPRKGHTVLYISEAGDLVRKDGFGPKVIEVRQLKDGKLPAEQGGKATPQNKRRIRLEDQAINRAAERQIMASWTEALKLIIWTLVGGSGSRIDVDYPHTNPHGGYHDGKAEKTIADFRAKLEAENASFPKIHGAKDGDPMINTGSYDALTKVLDGMKPKELQNVVHALTAVSLRPVYDGVSNQAVQFALRNKPEVAPFFERTEAYLVACKNAELMTLIGEIGAGHISGLTKKGNVEYILTHKKAEYAKWVPLRFRTGAEAPAESSAPWESAPNEAAGYEDEAYGLDGEYEDEGELADAA